jgi:hypothetical protein
MPTKTKPARLAHKLRRSKPVRRNPAPKKIGAPARRVRFKVAKADPDKEQVLDKPPVEVAAPVSVRANGKGENGKSDHSAAVDMAGGPSVPRDVDLGLPSLKERSSYDADTAIKLYLR